MMNAPSDHLFDAKQIAEQIVTKLTNSFRKNASFQEKIRFSRENDL